MTRRPPLETESSLASKREVGCGCASHGAEPRDDHVVMFVGHVGRLVQHAGLPDASEPMGLPNASEPVHANSDMPQSATFVRPEDDELDLFGITHRGKVRPENQDHFLVSTVHPQVVIHGTSLPDPESLPLRGTRLATVLVLADGVGGATDGSLAARVATEAVMRYVASTLRSYHAAGSER